MPGKVCMITIVHNPFDNRIFHKEAKTLLEVGYEVTLIAQHDKNEVVDGINIVALSKPKNRLYRILFLGWEAYKLALKENADVYHFHDPEFLPWAKRLKNKTRAKVIYDVHEDYVTSIKQKRYMPFLIRIMLSKMFNSIERYFSTGMIKVLAEKYYIKRFPEGQTILNYPVLLDSARQNHNYSLNLSDNTKVIYTGGVSEDRGALIYAELVKLVPFLHVYVVGKCKKELQGLMHIRAGSSFDRLHIDGNGFIPFDKILSYYINGKWLAGLAIFPYSEHYYQKELTKFFEYMNFGIPIIASNFPTWKNLIEGNNCGICVNPLDFAEIENAINFLINNPDKAKVMGENGKKAVLKKYNWGIEGTKLVNLYKNIMNS
jgi:glycosyltransferase involved in cell wall biosynthesis